MLSLDFLKGIKCFSKEIKPIETVNWKELSRNPAAILESSKELSGLLEKNLDKIHWNCFYCNPAAIHLFEC